MEFCIKCEVNVTANVTNSFHCSQEESESETICQLSSETGITCEKFSDLQLRAQIKVRKISK